MDTTTVARFSAPSTACTFHQQQTVFHVIYMVLLYLCGI